jgi:hypothetical protein
MTWLELIAIFSGVQQINPWAELHLLLHHKLVLPQHNINSTRSVALETVQQEGKLCEF